MRKRLKLSIVVPSLNQGEYIDATLASLVNQQDIDPGELEIVVMDGGSTDQTPAVLQRWASKLAVCVCESDGGQTDALIKGFSRCTGDILGWLCSDDILEPWTVREVIDFFKRSPSVDFVYGDAVWIDRRGAFLWRKKEIPFKWFIWLHDHNYIPQPAAFWRRGLYDRVGGLSSSFDLAMDGDLFARFAQQTRPAHVPRMWARLRSYPAQKNKRFRAQSDREDRIIRQRLGISFENALAVGMRYCVAKAWRVAWKAALGAYW